MNKLVVFLCSFLILQESVFAKVIWTEKPSDTPKLVELPSIQPIVDQLDATVVYIATTSSKPRENSGQRRRSPGPMSPEDFFERFFEQMPQAPRRGSGSGFIISKEGHIITNNHVIESAGKIEVTISRFEKKGNNTVSKQETLPAEVIGRDPRTDIALLKIKPNGDLPVAPLGDSNLLSKGDWVIAIGNPFGLEHSVSLGIVSAKEREISPNENRRFDEFIQTDAAINFGNSGGPLVNVKGEVIGINTAITAQGSGIGFAVPINVAKQIIPQLLEKGSVSRGFLGVTIQDVTTEIKDAMGLDVSAGVLVNGIMPDGPAAKSDLKVGDIIVKVNAQNTPDAKALQKVIGSQPPGAVATLQVLRDKKTREVKVKLGNLDSGEEPTGQADSDEADLLGLVVSPNPSGPGVIIEGGDLDSPAFEGGVRPGDVLVQMAYRGKKVEIGSVKDYLGVIGKLKEGESVVLQIERKDGEGRQLSYVPLRVPSKKQN